MIRASVVAFLILASPLAAQAPDSAGWLLNVAASATTDIPNVLLMTSSTAPVIFEGQALRPRLQVFCRQGQHDPSVILDMGQVLDPDPFDDRRRVKIETRIDQQKAKEEHWSISRALTDAYAPGKARDRVRDWSKGHELLLAVPMYRGQFVMVRFPLTGLAERLPTLTQICGVTF